MEELSAVLLAGGFSSRMGTDKADLLLDGKTFLQRQVEKLQALGISEILISGVVTCPEGTVALPDVYPHRGPLSGIHAGLAAARNPAVLILPVDMPLIGVGTLCQLTQVHGDRPITVLEHDGALEPLVGIYDRSLTAACEAILQETRHSPRRLLEQVGYRTVTSTEPPISLMNCNTPEEYRQLQRAFLHPGDL